MVLRSHRPPRAAVAANQECSKLLEGLQGNRAAGDAAQMGKSLFGNGRCGTGCVSPAEWITPCFTVRVYDSRHRGLRFPRLLNPERLVFGWDECGWIENVCLAAFGANQLPIT